MSRGLIRYTHFDEQFEKLVPDERTRLTILAGLEATILIEPTVGELLNPDDDQPGSCWLVKIPAAPGWGTPEMILMYTFDDDHVWLTWVF
jgi:hypothetical protein